MIGETAWSERSKGCLLLFAGRRRVAMPPKMVTKSPPPRHGKGKAPAAPAPAPAKPIISSEERKAAMAKWMEQYDDPPGEDDIQVSDTGIVRTEKWVRNFDNGPDPPDGRDSMVNNWLSSKTEPDYATFNAKQSVRQYTENGVLMKQIGWDKAGTFHPVRHFHSGAAYERYRRGLPPGYMGYHPHDAVPVTGGKSAPPAETSHARARARPPPARRDARARAHATSRARPHRPPAPCARSRCHREEAPHPLLDGAAGDRARGGGHYGRQVRHDRRRDGLRRAGEACCRVT